MVWNANILLSLIILFSSTLHTTILAKSSSTAHSAFVFPVTKNALNLQHTTILYQRTPLVPINVAIDLGGAFVWVSCGSNTYGSVTYVAPPCNSSQCSAAQNIYNFRTKCRNNTCIVYSKNVLTSKVTPMKLSEDVLNLHVTNGLNPTSIVSIPQFLFLCAPNLHIKGLPFQAQGVAGLGHGSRLGLLSQVYTKFNLKQKFSMCFSPSPNAPGVLFLGDGPYDFSPGIDVSKLLIFTRLIVIPRNKIGHGLYNSYEYFIKVSSIRVNGKTTPSNSSLAKINTVSPYTILETSIYDSIARIFVEEAMLANISKVAPKAPLDICFSTENDSGERMRLSMPVIDLVLQDENVFWRVFGLNSMVQMSNDTMCLGFLDGGLNSKASITIGSYLLEDNLLQFDLVSSRLGFTNSLLLRETGCANFNFTTNS